MQGSFRWSKGAESAPAGKIKRVRGKGRSGMNRCSMLLLIFRSPVQHLHSPIFVRAGFLMVRRFLFSQGYL
jgi:hypothetical protein